MAFDISRKGLTTLKDVEFPPNVTTLYCSNNNLTTLEGCPPSVIKLHCTYNLLTTLEGCPPNVTMLNCSCNQLTNLKGCPLNVKELYCGGNLLTTLDCIEFYQNIETLYCHSNKLTNLKGCPSSVKKLICRNNSLIDQYQNKSLNEIHKINRIKALKKGISLLRNLLSALRIQRFWRKWWYEELDSEGVNRFIRKSFIEFNN